MVLLTMNGLTGRWSVLSMMRKQPADTVWTASSVIDGLTREHPEIAAVAGRRRFSSLPALTELAKAGFLDRVMLQPSPEQRSIWHYSLSQRGAAADLSWEYVHEACHQIVDKYKRTATKRRRRPKKPVSGQAKRVAEALPTSALPPSFAGAQQIDPRDLVRMPPGAKPAILPPAGAVHQEGTISVAGWQFPISEARAIYAALHAIFGAGR